MKSFLRILGFARPLGLHSGGYLVLVFFATVFGVFNLTAFIPLLQLLFDRVNTAVIVTKPTWSFELSYFQEAFHYYFGQVIATEGKLIALFYLCGLIGVSVLLANILRYSSQIILARVRIQTIRNLRNEAFSALLKKDLGYFTFNRKGDLISRITGDVQEIEQSVVSSLKVLIKDPLLILGYFIALFTISAELTLYTLLLVPVTGLLVSVIARRIKKWSARSQQSLGRLSSILEESLGGIRIVKAFSAEKRLKERFSSDVTHYASETYQIAKKSNLASPISEVIGTIVLIILLVIGGRMVLGGSAVIDAAQFIGFLIIFSQTLIPAKAISVAIGQINRGLAAGDRVFELMDTEETESKSKLPRLEKNELKQSISFQNVAFSYRQVPVLHDISFTVPKGKIVGLVGVSGSGKTTIADLLMGFYAPDSGKIFIDGIDLESINQHSWRNIIGLVSQQLILFNDTVTNNISFGSKKNSQKQVKTAAQKANADGFIMNLPYGYDSMLGEAGDTLSGGERQRITIARAIVNDPHLLILDEATSSLDALSEEAVGLAFRTAVSNRTTLLISHKRSTIELADEVLVLEDGTIVEQGTPSGLKEQSHLYRQLTE